jgi:acetyltransferase-like isoleucine patch superfamily enzyme
MNVEHISLGKNVQVDISSSINNISLGDGTKVAHSCRAFGNPEHILKIGMGCYFGPFCLIDGFNAQVEIGNYVSFSQNVNLMSGSGPNASEKMQRIFPIKREKVSIGDHCWVGASVIIMPGVSLGKHCVVAANSFVNQSFPDYSIIGGSPAKLLRVLSQEEIAKLND